MRLVKIETLPIDLILVSFQCFFFLFHMVSGEKRREVFHRSLSLFHRLDMKHDYGREREHYVFFLLKFESYLQ